MKLNIILFKQHIGKQFKNNWISQGKKKILNTKAEDLLMKNGIHVYKPQEIYYENKFEKVEIVGFKPKAVEFDKTHPNWHDEVLLTYKDNDVLLEGLNQAQVLTNSVTIQEGIPKKYSLQSISKELRKHCKNIILGAHVYDAEQQKLPKRKDPERPAWNFPRDYKITHGRINQLMTSKLLHLLETNENYDIVKKRYILNDLLFSFPFERDGSLIQFQLTGDSVVVSDKPLNPIIEKSMSEWKVPDLHPLKCTVTLNEENIYEIENIYPIRKDVLACHPHTIFIHHDRTQVKNIFEEEVTETQIHGISLMKTFTIAASYAKQRFGENISDLPTPVTIQCVNTDGRLFHFGILQLNTLNLENCDNHNVWFQTERLPLFNICQYESGRAVLEGYNDEVLKHLVSFYRNN
ncbi:hypothetical protein WA026_018622 [Henosepilachna vigintioctopunctata]|uniref:Large ribosomal subunit protein mL37 n=1 Tax=Henosepilachna vigintioctopunctata TaxID=420089 RepID=A0AAW1U8U6_9CUCU